MAAHNIQLSDDQLLAEYIPLNDFKGLLEQTVAVGPDLAAMVIRNGEVVTDSQGGHIGVGGIWRGIKDALLGQHALRLLIADLKPFQLVCGINAVSRDKVAVAGEIAIEFQVNPENPSGVLGMMREHSSVVKEEVMARLAPHLGDRVIEAVISKVDAGELRGATAVQDKVQAEIMREVERIAGDMSLMARAVSLRWAYNEEEIAAIEKRNSEREQERQDVAFAASARELEREHEITKLKISTKLDLEKVKAASETELEQMVLGQELAYADARDAGVRLQEMKILEHEYAKLKREREEKFEREIAGAQNENEKARLTVELHKIQAEIKEFDVQQELRLDRLKREQELELGGEERDAEWKHAEQVRQANIAATQALNEVDHKDASARADIKNKAEQAAHDRRMEEKRLEQEALLAQQKLFASQTPEVIMAMQAGLSTDVAQVLVKQAEAQASNAGEVKALLREQIKMAQDAKLESAEQARHFFETATQGHIGVAQSSSGGASSPATGATNPSGNDLVACVNQDCGQMISVSARFCHICGQQMRT